MNEQSKVWLYKKLRNVVKAYFRETGDVLSVNDVTEITEYVFDDLRHNGEIGDAEEDSTEPEHPVQ